MGRKNWKETTASKRGPGRKAKKQGDPLLPTQVSQDVKKVKSTVLGGRIQQRARKRATKVALKQAINQGAKKAKGTDYSAVPPQESSPPVSEDEAPPVSEGDSSPESKTNGLSEQRLELFSGGSGG